MISLQILLEPGICRIKPASFISWSVPDVVDIQNESLQGVWSSEVRHSHRGFGAEPDRLAHMLIFMWKNTGKMELSSLRRSLALQTVYSLQNVSSVDATFAPDFSSQACTVTSSANVTWGQNERQDGSFEQITSDERSCFTIMSFVCFSVSKRRRKSIKVRLSSPINVIALYFLSEQAGTDINLRITICQKFGLSAHLSFCYYCISEAHTCWDIHLDINTLSKWCLCLSLVLSFTQMRKISAKWHFWHE